jgi:hypothetical protein
MSRKLFVIKHRWVWVSLCWLWIASLITGCGPQDQNRDAPDPPTVATRTPPPTPSVEALRVNGGSSSSPRLRVILRSVNLLKRAETTSAQVFVVLTDPQGNVTYLLYPANQPGKLEDQFDLSSFPLDVAIQNNTDGIVLWVLAVHNTHYQSAEALGLDTLAASLSTGFRTWLREGDPTDDPLAAIVSASNGALYEWFAGIEVLGQGSTVFLSDEDWGTGLHSLRSADEGLTAVYTAQLFAAQEPNGLPIPPSATPTGFNPSRPGYTLRVNETFENGTSAYNWYEGRDSTYINHLTDGAYEIQLTDIQQRDHGVSWGSIEGEQFQNYIVEAQVRLVESGVKDGRYGIWFHYKDDYNFIYFGISNQGEYRVAIIKENSSRIEIKDWTPHPAIKRGAATNILTIETSTDGTIILGINGEQVTTFNDDTFTDGSVAFFCYAESVPTTCRLERLLIWEPTG